MNFDYASFAWSGSRLTLDGAGMNFATHGLDLSAGWLCGHFSGMPFADRCGSEFACFVHQFITDRFFERQ